MEGTASISEWERYVDLSVKFKDSGDIETQKKIIKALADECGVKSISYTDDHDFEMADLAYHEFKSCEDYLEHGDIPNEQGPVALITPNGWRVDFFVEEGRNLSFSFFDTKDEYEAFWLALKRVMKRLNE